MTECKSKASFVHLNQTDLIALVYPFVIIFSESAFMEQVAEYFSLIELPYSMYAQKAHHYSLLLNLEENRYTEIYYAFFSWF